MGDKSLHRKDFLKSLIGAKNQKDNTAAKLMADTDNTGQDQPDPLFDKYSRKHLDGRQYSNQVATPDNNGSFGLRVGNVTSGLAPYAGPWTIWEVMHLLKRCSFGAKQPNVDYLLTLTPSAAVNSLLSIGSLTNPSSKPLNFYQNDIADSSGVALGAPWTNNILRYLNGSDDGTVDYYRTLSLERWSWGICLNDNPNASIREKMVQFWYHFIPIHVESIRNTEGNAALMGHDYMKLLRTNCMGNFYTLIKAIALQPAMLVYLGGQYSTAAAPNENFARELFELFTLGKTPTQNFTEEDVQSASKIFSGWHATDLYGANAYPFNVSFVPSLHNQSNKTFSSFFGNTVINNQPSYNGANEIDSFFDMLFTYQGPTMAKYLCRRLYRFFVYYDIDANVETNVIEPLATLLINNNWQIAPVMSALLKSEHFFDVVNRGVMIKSPIDYIAGMLRTLKVNTTSPAGASQLKMQYDTWSFFQYFGTTQLEQGFCNVPNVSGWKAYYQSPSFYQNWINSNTIQQRSLLITYLINGSITLGAGNTTLKIDVINFVQQFPNATIQDPDLLIDTIVQYLFAVDLPQTFKAQTKVQNLLTGQTTNYYWTNAWNAFMLNQANVTNRNIVTERLTALLTSFLELAEFQLM
jgi:uncharacterized protein (DUF1800 family)